MGATPSGSWPGERMRPSTNAVVERLAEVVADRAEHHREAARAVEVVNRRSHLVDDHQRVHPDVALGMPLGLLRAAGERRHFRDERGDDPELEAQREPDGRPLREQQELLNFAQHALAGQVVEGDGAAHASGAFVHRQREPRRELQGAQHAKAVVGERPLVDHPEDAALEVVPAAERVEVLLRERIEEDGVDGEIAPPACLLDGHARVAGDLEAAVPAADLRLAARQRHIDARHLVDGERLADGIDAAGGFEQAAQAARLDAVHLEVDVGGGEPEEPVAHPSAGDQRAAARGAHRLRDRQRRPGQRLDRAAHYLR